MAEIVKFTPKEPRLSVEVLDTMAAAAAERYQNAPWAVRDGQEPRCSIRAVEGKVVRPAAAARWVYENVTLPKAQHDAFRKMLVDAGINKQEAGDTALDALIERTVITQPALIKAVAARHKAKVFVDPAPEAEDTVVPVDFEAREREAEDVKIGLLKDWLDEYGWCGLMVLADERPGADLNDQDGLSYWVQDNWHGSTAFRRAPLEGLRRQAAHDTIHHWMAGVTFDLARLNRIAANALARR